MRRWRAAAPAVDRAVAAVATAVERIRALDTERLAVDDAGDVAVQSGVVGLLEDILAHDAAQALVTSITGVRLTDSDRDGRPDTRAQLAAAYEATAAAGVPFDADNLVRTPGEVGEVLWADDDVQATALTVGLPGSRLGPLDLLELVDFRSLAVAGTTDALGKKLLNI